MSGLTRRAALTAAAIPLATAAAWGAPTALTRLDSLWERRTTLAAESRALCAAHSSAQAALPAWAAPGPSMLRGDGTWSGSYVGWPRIEDGKLPIRETFMLNRRPGPMDLRRDFEQTLAICSGHGLVRARQVYRSKMRDLIVRIRAQREEEAKVGFPAIKERWQIVTDEALACEDEIESVDVSPQKAVALMLLSVNFESRRDASFNNPGSPLAVAAAPLGALRPFTAGILRAQVDYLLEHPDMALSNMPFWRE